jgi:hypothetical protein
MIAEVSMEQGSGDDAESRERERSVPGLVITKDYQHDTNELDRHGQVNEGAGVRRTNIIRDAENEDPGRKEASGQQKRPHQKVPPEKEGKKSRGGFLSIAYAGA